MQQQRLGQPLATWFEDLESRQLFAFVVPTAYEQYMIELTNWARMNPSAVAARYGVGLNEGPPANPISTSPAQPLAVNPYLTDAARSYGQYFVDTGAAFSHTADGRWPTQRMQAAGYNITDGTENAQLHIGGSGPDLTAAVENDFGGYYDDLSVPGRWHRLNLFWPAGKEIGVGVVSGPYQGWPSFITVMDFAYSNGSPSFLTGVSYTDITGDNFFTPGEQMSGAQILAVRNSDGARFSTMTWLSGGYSLALPAGTYTVWGSGGGLGNGWVRYNNVTIGSQNVKRDFRPDYVNNATGPDFQQQIVPDANGDGRVDVNDLNILAANWKQFGRTFSQGNFDNSTEGLVDEKDLSILAAYWGVTLTPPAGAAPASSASSDGSDGGGSSFTPIKRSILDTVDGQKSESEIARG